MKSTDGELLTRFIHEQDDAAFEEIVLRHGRMVKGVCGRILGNQHDAEDAFQASFLVLARKAATLKIDNSLAGWLHAVALRVGLKARGKALLRHQREREAGMMRPNEHNADWQQLQPVLDEELGRLADNFRLPIVLCCIEGKTNEEAAAELGWTNGEVRSRLTKGREILRRRLSRQGIALSIGLLFALITERSLAVPLSPATVSSTVSAARALTSGTALPSGMISESAISLADETFRELWWTKAASVAVGLLFIAVIAAAATTAIYRLGTSIWGSVTIEDAEVIREKSKTASSQVLPHSGREGPEATKPADKTQTAKPPENRETAKNVNVLEVLQASISKKYPKAGILEIENKRKDGKATYEVEINLDGEKIELTLDEKGGILEEERELAIKDLPKAVQEQLRLRYPDSRIKEADEKRRGGKILYEIELRAGDNEIEVTFSPAGKALIEKIKNRENRTIEPKTKNHRGGAGTRDVNEVF